MLDWISFDTTWLGADALTLVLMIGIGLAGLIWFWMDHK